MRHDSPSAWHGRFSAEPLNPEHHEPLALPFHWDKFTQNLVPAQVPLLQSKLSSVLLSDSQTALSWLKQQSDHTLPETNKLGTSAPITGRLRSAASEKPLSHCCLLAGGKNNWCNHTASSNELKARLCAWGQEKARDPDVPCQRAKQTRVILTYKSVFCMIKLGHWSLIKEMPLIHRNPTSHSNMFKCVLLPAHWHQKKEAVLVTHHMWDKREKRNGRICRG